MVEEWKFGKGLFYGSLLSLGFWIIMFDAIYTLVR